MSGRPTTSFVVQSGGWFVPPCVDRRTRCGSRRSRPAELEQPRKGIPDAGGLLDRPRKDRYLLGAAAAMLEHRLRAYAKLWPLLDVDPEPEAGADEIWPVASARPQPAERSEDIPRDAAERRQELREWYCDKDGSRLLLGHDAQTLWSCVEGALAGTTEANPANRR